MTENNTFSTPNIRKYKSLGVRHIGRNKTNVCKTPLSESKISMIISTTSASNSPKTPLTGPSQEIHQEKEESKSTGSLPVYRLSMSKRFRSQYKKKKLEFSTTADDRETETFPTESNNNVNREIFIENIVSKQHESKISELKNAIEIWKTGFKNCLDDLSNKLNEDKEIILQRLQIPSDMLKLA